MAPSRNDLELAIAAYWGRKDKQLTAAQLAGSTAEGSSKAVRGGGHFNPIANLIARFFLDGGYPPESIHASGNMIRLPGYYRPTKSWDLVVVHDGVLVAAVELKALGGPSFGNNYNNRVEEALGNGVDLERSNWRGLLGREKPWLGYFFIIQDEEGSRRPGRATRTGAFPPEEVWERASYQERFALSGERPGTSRSGWRGAGVCPKVGSADEALLPTGRMLDLGSHRAGVGRRPLRGGEDHPRVQADP